AQAIRPLFWILDKFHIDFGGIQQFLARLRTGQTRALPRQVPGGNGGAFGRLLGLMLLAAIVGGIFLLIRRRRAGDDWFAEGAKEEPLRAVQLGRAEKIRLRKPPRRELPADTVRRWYAEALLLLERKGLSRAPNSTPDEFLEEVGRAFPDCRYGFHELTRAYEEVRYGSVTFDRDRVQELEPRRAFVMVMLERAPK